jgi:hypothetical protein
MMMNQMDDDEAVSDAADCDDSDVDVGSNVKIKNIQTCVIAPTTTSSTTRPSVFAWEKKLLILFGKLATLQQEF